MKIDENTLESWSTGPSRTETDKYENALTAIRKAISTDKHLSGLDISVLVQGSYRARTNIRQDSDVDICVRHNGVFFADYPAGKTDKDFGHDNGGMSFYDYKDMIQSALESYFGKGSVARGKKAFDVHSNSYRIDADVIPTFEYQWYTGELNHDGTPHYHSGVAFVPDGGHRIINWPEQTYNNGTERNLITGRRYKRVVRILKRLRNDMQENKISESFDMASFLVECLVWNAPVEAFGHDTYTDILRHVIADVWNAMRDEDSCSEWGEVNELKYLFRTAQPWSRQEASLFLDAAWNYMGYK